MAKYDVTYSCGHTETKQLLGPEADRQRYIAGAATNLVCCTCYADDKTAALAALEAELGLPELAGSEKQIAWARTIRGQQVAKVQESIEVKRARVKPEAETKFAEMASTVVVSLAGKSDARWWIDTRELDADALMLKAVRG